MTRPAVRRRDKPGGYTEFMPPRAGVVVATEAQS